MGCVSRTLGGFGRDSRGAGGLGFGRDSRTVGAIGRGSSILGVVVVVFGPVTRLFEGRLGSNSCKAFRFVFLLAWVARQALQVANTLPDLFVGKQDSRRFWRQPEQYFESILNV